MYNSRADLKNFKSRKERASNAFCLFCWLYCRYQKSFWDHKPSEELRTLVYLLFHVTLGTGRITAGKPKTRTIVHGTKWHCIATDYWFSFPFTRDDKHHSLVFQGARSFCTLEPSRREAAWGVGWSQRNGVAADYGNTGAFKKKHRRTNLSNYKKSPSKNVLDFESKTSEFIERMCFPPWK